MIKSFRSIVAILLIWSGISIKAQVNFSSLEEILYYADEHEVSIRSADLQEEIYTSEFIV